MAYVLMQNGKWGHMLIAKLGTNSAYLFPFLNLGGNKNVLFILFKLLSQRKFNTLYNDWKFFPKEQKLKEIVGKG